MATIAELCFALQCALFVQRLSEITGMPWLDTAARVFVPVVILAEIVLLVRGAVAQPHRPRYRGIAVGAADAASGRGVRSGGIRRARVASRDADRGLPVLRGCAGLTLVFDVRMYVQRWRTHAGGYLTLATGLRDSRQRRHPTLTWDVWRVEAPWMTVYFSIGVWTSLAMVLLERAASRS